MEKNCKWCGTKFVRAKKLSDKQWNSRLFCSNSCKAMKPASVPMETIAGMYCSGMSSEEIGLLVGKSGRGVLLLLKRMGVAIRTLSEGKKISQSRPEARKKMSLSRKGMPCPESTKAALRSITGKSHHSWKGGMTMNSGYWYFTTSPENGENAGKALHCVIAEISLGRKLKKGEVVHHKDHNKTNNSPDNLHVCSSQIEHMKIHAMDNIHGIGNW